MARERSKYTVQFFIEGKRTQGIGYRAHLGMLALISDIERLYAENIPKERNIEKVVVYAGAKTKKDINNFYRNVRQKIPKEADVSEITKPKPYHSPIQKFPTVTEFVSTLTAQELAKGVHAITTLGEKAEVGFGQLAAKLDTVGEQVVNALVKGGIIQRNRKKR